MRAGDVSRCDFGVPAQGEPAQGTPGFVRPVVVITADEALEYAQRAVAVVPCTSTVRGWTSEVAIGDFGVAQSHLVTTVNVDRLIEFTSENVGPVAPQQVRELVADLLGW